MPAILILLVLLNCQILRGDDLDASPAQTDVLAQLAGPPAKEWIFTAFETQMGPSAKCKAGKSFLFKPDHTLIISTCVDGSIVKTTHHWKIKSLGKLDTIISIDGKERFLLFYRRDGAQFMRLRDKSNTIGDPTTDMEFRLDED